MPRLVQSSIINMSRLSSTVLKYSTLTPSLSIRYRVPTIVQRVAHIVFSALVLFSHMSSPLIAAAKPFEISMLLLVGAPSIRTEQKSIPRRDTVIGLVVTTAKSRAVKRFTAALKLAFELFGQAVTRGTTAWHVLVLGS